MDNGDRCLFKDLIFILRFWTFFTAALISFQSPDDGHNTMPFFKTLGNNRLVHLHLFQVIVYS